MRAVQVLQTGGPEVLTVADIPVPEPKAGEALVRIHAAGVNFIDVYLREGRYPAPLPFVSGQEGAGVVSELGDGVTNVKVGDRVAYVGHLGSYAEYAAVPAHRLIRIPDELDFQQAAAAMLQGMTAHYLCRSAFPLKQGETALVHAAAGGVGLLLVQMIKKIGARVIATAGSNEKASLAKKAGADEVIVYTETDFEPEVLQLTNRKGVDVVYDGVGKSTFEKDLNVLRPRGYLVLFGGSSGAVPPFDLVKLSQKGSLFVTRPTLAHYTVTREELEWRANDVIQAIVHGELQVRVHKTYSMIEAGQAHRDLEGRRTTGKLLLVP